MKSDCPNPRIERDFDGTCRQCEQPGHRASDCPLKVCRACGEGGHSKADCTANRMQGMFNALGIEDLEVEEAWKKIETADTDKDLEDIKMVRIDTVCLDQTLTDTYRRASTLTPRPSQISHSRSSRKPSVTAE